MSDLSIVEPIRRRRFHRSEVVPPFQLTERDVEIARQVARHRFLRSTHISLLLEAPHKKICERLTLLYHAGYLDRPRSQLEYHVRNGGSAPYVYGLGNRGARLLKGSNEFGPTGVDWARKNRDTTHQFLLHALSIADFRVALAVACRTGPDVRLIEPDELLQSAPEQTRQAPNPWSWRVRVQFKGQITEVGVIPDYVFALIVPDGRRRPFVVEIDRGTMPIERASLSQTSILRKFLAYEASYRQWLHTSRFDWKNFRVLIKTTSQERANSMHALIQNTSEINGSALFLLSHQSALIQSDILTIGWSNSRGAATTLI
jgi:hypothetical protein